MRKRKIIFLYTEIATYFLACVKELLKQDGVEVHVMCYEVNREAPFEFAFPEDLNVYSRNAFTDRELLNLIKSISPDIIVCSGWIDKGYLEICRCYKEKSVTVLTLDNQWKGKFRQYVASWLSGFYLHQRFSYCWIPGKPQQEYALKLGFDENHILTDFYSCDFPYFHEQYLKNRESKKAYFPKRFIYTGRYVPHKGVENLWEIFAELQERNPNDWELWCLGTGDLPPAVHPKIKHFGFVQPADLSVYIRKTGVFVLPSHFEPWGVVVHEFTASGFPVICSVQTGAHIAFVENNLNGYIYDADQKDQLKLAMEKIMGSTPERLIEMGDASARKAEKITPQSWVKQLIALL